MWSSHPFALPVFLVVVVACGGRCRALASNTPVSWRFVLDSPLCWIQHQHGKFVIFPRSVYSCRYGVKYQLQCNIIHTFCIRVPQSLVPLCLCWTHNHSSINTTTTVYFGSPQTSRLTHPICYNIQFIHVVLTYVYYNRIYVYLYN